MAASERIRYEQAKLGDKSTETCAAEVFVVRLATDSGICINTEQQIWRWLSVLPDDGRYAAPHFADLCPGVTTVENVHVEYEDVRRKVATRN